MKQISMIFLFLSILLAENLSSAYPLQLPYFDQYAIKTNTYNDDIDRTPANDSIVAISSDTELTNNSEPRYPSSQANYQSCYDVIGFKSHFFRCE